MIKVVKHAEVLRSALQKRGNRPRLCVNSLAIKIIRAYPPAEQLQGTLEYMKSLNARVVHACHCTDLNSKIELSKVVNLKEKVKRQTSKEALAKVFRGFNVKVIVEK